jgi:GxxExxY protein
MIIEEVARTIVDCSFKVHRALGPGLLEKIYEACLSYELERAGLKVERQVPVPITYGDLEFNEGFRLDLLVQHAIICEIKAVEKHNPVWEAQLLSYMKLTDCRLGFLINFNVPIIKNGIKRMIF